MTQTPSSQPPDRYALILYGSETGNSHEVADRLGDITERLHFKTIVTEMDDFADVVEKEMKSGQVKKIPSLRIDSIRKATLVVLVTSTAGQGEFPKNSRRLWKSLLKKSLPKDYLDGVQYTTFGLGDSSYAKFNRAARLLHIRFQGLGAKELFPRGEADEQHADGIDGAFLPWSMEFKAHIQTTFPLPEGVTPIPPDTLLPFKWTHQIAEPEPEPESLPLLTAGKASDTPTDLTTPKDPDPEPDPASRETELPPKDRPVRPNPKIESESEPEMMIYRPPEDRTPDVPCPMLKEPFDREDLEVDKPISQENIELAPVPGLVAYLQQNKRLTPESHWQDVREITLTIPGNVRYKPGDTLIVYPQNFPEDVQALIDLMDWATVADVPLQFERDPGTSFYDTFHVTPSPTNFYPRYKSTLRQLLTLNLDITAIPQRKVLDLLACYTKNPTHKQRLLELSNPAFTDEFFDYATRPRRSILEVLQDFSSVKLPFQIVTTVFPTIRGRPYSVSSGGKQLVTYNNSACTKVQLLVAIVHYKTVLQKVRRGLCTRWLAALQEERSMIMVDFHHTDLYLDIQKASRQPLIMIAPGTGLAPCRSLIWDRAEIANDYPVSLIYLFFGGRNEKADYFYEEEWKTLKHLVDVVTAFSRDDPTGRKVYVQERIREHGELIVRLLFGCAAIIIVCGSSGSMPNAVREAFVDVVEEHHPAKPDRAGANALLARLEDIGRYKQETW